MPQNRDDFNEDFKKVDAASPCPILGYESAETARDVVTIYDFSDIRDVDSLGKCPYCGNLKMRVPNSLEDQAAAVDVTGARNALPTFRCSVPISG